MRRARGSGRSTTSAAVACSLLLAGGGAAVVVVAARLSFALPGIDLPQTGQTLAVLVVGAALGLRRGTLAIALYILSGALGLPVFADGASGVDTILGPSGGYLLGFLVAAAFLGWRADEGKVRRTWWATLGSMLAAHALILGLGAAGLVIRVGVAKAWLGGVVPFLPGAVVKSALAALLVRWIGAHPVWGSTSKVASSSSACSRTRQR